MNKQNQLKAEPSRTKQKQTNTSKHKAKQTNKTNTKRAQSKHKIKQIQSKTKQNKNTTKANKIWYRVAVNCIFVFGKIPKFDSSTKRARKDAIASLKLLNACVVTPTKTKHNNTTVLLAREKRANEQNNRKWTKQANRQTNKQDEEVEQTKQHNSNKPKPNQTKPNQNKPKYNKT